jgi:hypothetical protein
MTGRNLTAEARLMIAEIHHETGPDSTESDHACRELTYQGRLAAADLGLTD